jgi:hypothetical protein
MLRRLLCSFASFNGGTVVERRGFICNGHVVAFGSISSKPWPLFAGKAAMYASSVTAYSSTLQGPSITKATSVMDV